RGRRRHRRLRHALRLPGVQRRPHVHHDRDHRRLRAHDPGGRPSHLRTARPPLIPNHSIPAPEKAPEKEGIIMRTRRLGILAAIGATVLLAGCAASGDTTGGGGEPVVLKVAAVTAPMTDVVEAAGEAIGDGYEIELVE